MNIFKDLEGILASQKAEQTSSATDLLRLAAEIRTKLGGQGYLVESYLSHVFEALVATSGYDAASTGFEESAKLRNLCFHAMDSRFAEEAQQPRHLEFQLTDVRKESQEHPFYPVVKRHFKEYPDKLRQRFTIVNRHYTLLSQAFLKSALTSFLDEEEEKISGAFDILELNELYAKISDIVGEPLMEQLNLMLKEQFLSVPVCIGFAYGLSCALLDSLVYRDSETGKQVFQLLMDECTEKKRRSPDGI